MSNVSMKKCDHCGTLWDDNLTEENYEKSRCHGEIMIMLPKRIVEARTRVGECAAHAETVKVDFCSPDCLIGAIRKVIPKSRGRKGE